MLSLLLVNLENGLQAIGARASMRTRHLPGTEPLSRTYRLDSSPSSYQLQHHHSFIRPAMETLPLEIIFQIARFLDPLDVVILQLVCRRFLALGRDNAFWREQCFEHSAFLKSLRKRRGILADYSEQGNHLRDLARALASGNGIGNSRLAGPRAEARDLQELLNEKKRIMANWDPSYPREKVCWYDEYISRNAPINTSWLQQPRNRESAEHEHMEVRGMALYTESGESISTLVVAPLDDGSVCVWDIAGRETQKGSIIARSKPGILSPESIIPSQSRHHLKMINMGVTECVSVDDSRKRAYIAVQNKLVEIDLETLSTITSEQFPFPITTLSEVKHPLPITVGTNRSIYLHDTRNRGPGGQSSWDQSGNLDAYNLTFGSNSRDFRGLLNPAPSPVYSHLYHPGPLSILHMPSSGSDWDYNGDIYVAGRFPSILNYDRRYFPKVRGTIHSGARLCSMASLPHPFSSMDKDLARVGELSIEQVWESKTRPGRTLIACDCHMSNISDGSAGSLQSSTYKNRQTASGSKLLSVVNHGTRIVTSDGNGNLKWVERDGSTEARRWNIAHGSVEAPMGMFGTEGDSYMNSGSGDVVLKLANTHNGRGEKPITENDLVLWTGEKIGLLRFSSKPGFTAETFEEKGPQTAEEAHKEREERNYSQLMRKALQANADEVRFMSGLGLGSGGSNLP
ncbi:hypothetical protein BGZ60DRAFT_512698 [Tricladium varicosporioides]|nr:hypothetical protein BGZ60DRAFT_512698 [Hymenoscyphus varicosporioides]